MHAFITTRLDYLNSLLYGMPDYIIKRLLNAVARIITNLGKYDHITDAMKKLHRFFLGRILLHKNSTKNTLTTVHYLHPANLKHCH